MKYLLTLLFFSSCGPVVAFSGKKPAEVPVPAENFKSLFPKQAWTDVALASVNDAGLDVLKPTDARKFCPNGMNAHNWVHLLAAMAKFESGFDPNQVYRESFGVNSIGLLQLSVSDKAYGCAFKTEADVKDPIKNIQCAVKILKKWVLSDGVISSGSNKGGARYWSVLRPSGKLSSVQATLKGNCE